MAEQVFNFIDGAIQQLTETGPFQGEFIITACAAQGGASSTGTDPVLGGNGGQVIVTYDAAFINTLSSPINVLVGGMGESTPDTNVGGGGGGGGSFVWAGSNPPTDVNQLLAAAGGGGGAAFNIAGNTGGTEDPGTEGNGGNGGNGSDAGQGGTTGGGGGGGGGGITGGGSGFSDGGTSLGGGGGGGGFGGNTVSTGGTGTPAGTSGTGGFAGAGGDGGNGTPGGTPLGNGGGTSGTDFPGGWGGGGAGGITGSGGGGGGGFSGGSGGNGAPGSTEGVPGNGGTSKISVDPAAIIIGNPTFNVGQCDGDGTVTITYELQVCIPATGEVDPAELEVEAGNDATFTVNTTGTDPITFQWQVSEDGGTTYTDLTDDDTYSGVTTDTLLISNVPESFDGNMYRALLSNDCTESEPSSPGTLTITACEAVVITKEPQDIEVHRCFDASFRVRATGQAPLEYQWQVETGDGIFRDIQDNSHYFGTNTAKLQISCIPLRFDDYLYRVVVSNACSSETSEQALLTVTTDPIVILQQPRDTTACTSECVTLCVVAEDPGDLRYQWQVSENFGYSFDDITDSCTYSGAQTPNLCIHVLTTSLSQNLYQVEISRPGTDSVTSNEVAITIFPRLQIFHITDWETEEYLTSSDVVVSETGLLRLKINEGAQTIFRAADISWAGRMIGYSRICAAMITLTNDPIDPLCIGGNRQNTNLCVELLLCGNPLPPEILPYNMIEAEPGQSVTNAVSVTLFDEIQVRAINATQTETGRIQTGAYFLSLEIQT